MTATTTTPVPAGLPLTRCRRAALRFGAPVCLALVAVSGLSLVATFGGGTFPVRYTAPAAARSLTVNVAGGRLALEGTATGPATVTGTGRYSIVRSTITEHDSGGGADFGYQCHFSFGTCQLDAAISAPADVPVSASTGGGTATVGGTAGPVTVFTGGGGLLAQLVSGPLSLTTDGGNIVAVRVSSATVTASTGGGDVEIEFTRVPHDVEVNTAGGNITLVLPRGPA